MPQASVVIPARDAAATIEWTLAALEAQDVDAAYEVIVVDDGSRDATAALAERAGARVISQPPVGPAAARNRGAAAASAETLAFTDADCAPAPGWLAAGLAGLRGADLVQGAVCPPPGEFVGPFDRTLWVTREHGLYETASLFVRRELFARLGGFEAWLEPTVGKALAEDVQFGWRARRAGARTLFRSDALVHHAVFRRGPAGFVSERVRRRYFPDIVREIPELRREFLFARVFLNRRTAAFDAALLATGAAALRRSPLLLPAALPYLAEVWRRAAPWRRYAPLVTAVDLAADLVGLAALLEGSARRRAPVI